MLQVTFAEIARALEAVRSSVSAPEAHGALVGGLCADPNYTADRWLEEIVPEASQALESGPEQPLPLLYDNTYDALRGDELEFAPLLPDDESLLIERASALAQWCQGFLYGLGTGDLGSMASLPDEVDEVMRDITQIGRATIDPADFAQESEDDEESYAEVVEYVRVGVQLVYDELNAQRARRSETH
jgi:uncharacterized protein YgfB (UPF0149 family)